MATEYIFQRDARSLLHNGNFSQGLAYWGGSYLSHDQVKQSGNLASDLDTPHYGLDLQAGEYPEGIPTGAFQFIDRPDLYTYGSTRFVSMLQMFPLSDSRAMLKVIQGTTMMDGVVLDSKPQSSLGSPSQDNIFQSPFRHTELDENDRMHFTYPEAGSQVPITDYTGKYTGLYRTVRHVGNGLFGSVADIVVGNFAFLFDAQALEISVTAQNKMTPIIDPSHIDVDSLSVVEAGNKYVVEITGNVEALHATYGIEVINSTMTTADQFGVSEIIEAEVVGDKWVLTLSGLSNGTLAQNGPTYPLVSEARPINWAIFTSSFVGCTRTLPLFRYSMSVAYSYQTDSLFGGPQPPVIEFLSSTDTEVAGLGIVTNSLAMEASKTREVSLTTDVIGADGNVENAGWSRRVHTFDRETTRPLDGRLLLRFPSPEEQFLAQLISVATEGSPSQILGGTIPSNQFEFSFFTEANELPRDFLDPTSSPSFTLQANAYDLNEIANGTAGTEPAAEWLIPIIESDQISPVSGTHTKILTFQTVGTKTGIILTCIAEVSVPDTISVPTNTTWAPSFYSSAYVQYTKGPREDARARIGDVALYGTELTTTFDVLDGLVSTDPVALDANISFDPLITQIDHEQGAVPTGTVMLYMGGGVCPPGFNRVNSLSAGSSEGLVTIPGPDTVVYIEDRDESLLYWTNLSVPVVDGGGKVVPLQGSTTPLTLNDTSAGGTSIDIPYEIPQPLIQPGMSLRVSSEGSIEKLSGSEAADTNWFVAGTQPGDVLLEATAQDPVESAKPVPYDIDTPGYVEPRTTGDPSTYLITYPHFIKEREIEPPYRQDLPIGPSYKNQKALYPESSPAGASGVVQGDVGYSSQLIISPSGGLSAIEIRFYQVQAGDVYPLSASYPFDNADDYTWIGNNYPDAVSVGDVLWMDWQTALAYSSAESKDSHKNSTAITSTDNSANGFFKVGCIVRVTKKFQSAVSGFTYTAIIVERYDGKDLFVPNGYQIESSKGLFTFRTKTTKKTVNGETQTDYDILGRGFATLRPALLFGVGQQIENPSSATHVAAELIPGVFSGSAVTNSSDSVLSKQGSITWATVNGENQLYVTVPGEFPNDVTEIQVEPGGYLRYDEPDTRLDYGAGAHSHQIVESAAAPFETSAVPAYLFETISADIHYAASSHDHGFLPKYRYNLPAFHMFTACEKL